MATDKQLTANRRNAQKSTGPKTPGGKAVSSKNAIRHGLLARDVILKDEDPQAFEAMQTALVEELSPLGEIERQLVDRIVSALWRLRRLGRVEADIFEFESLTCAYKEALAALKDLEDEHRTSIFDGLDASTAETDVPKAHKAAVKRCQTAKNALSHVSANLGAAFISDATSSDALSKLSRYETGIERSLYLALRELERLQAYRSANEGSTTEVAQITVEDTED